MIGDPPHYVQKLIPYLIIFPMKYLLVTLLSLMTFPQLMAQVKINVNLTVKHQLGEVDSFDRQKFVNFHGTIDQNNWNTGNKTNNLIGDFLGSRDVHVGRNTGAISWYLRSRITEDPSRPGYADPASIASNGQISKSNYAAKTWAHPFEYLDDQILCTQLHPFYPDGQETNKGWSFSQADTPSEPFGTASGEFLGRYIQEFYGTGGATGQVKPKFVEVTNEPLWDLVTTASVPEDLTTIFRFHRTVAQEVHKYNPDIQVGGYCAAFPDFDKNNFQRWHDRDKHFMDVAGAEMDFWTIHLYDFPSIGGKTKYRKGSNMEATLDMLEQYSWMSFGEVKPIMISEYNAQTHDYNRQGWLAYRDWLKMKSTVSMMMQFMERANNINYAMPFFMLKAEWQYNSSVGPTSVHGARMLRRADEPTTYTGDFVYTEVIKLYDLLADIRGKRVDSYTDHMNMMVDTYVDGNKAYVMVNNLDFVAHNLDLTLSGLVGSPSQVEVRHLYLDGTSSSASPKLEINTYSTFANNLRIAPEGSYVIVFTFPSPILLDEQIEETKYYADTYLQKIEQNIPIKFQIDSLMLTEYGEAVLRIGIGRDHGRSLSPTVTINGTSLSIPNGFRGDDQADRDNFFGVMEIPVPYQLLQENNEVTVRFPDAGGHVSTVTMQVFNFSANFRSVSIEAPTDENLSFKIFSDAPSKNLHIVGNLPLQTMDVTLTTIQGQSVYQQAISGNTAIIDVRTLNAGVYIVKVETELGIQASKIMIE